MAVVVAVGAVAGEEPDFEAEAEGQVQGHVQEAETA